MRIIFVRHGEPDYARDCLTEAGSRIARDGGQGNIALKVELCGRVLILCAALPAVREVLTSAQTVLGEIGP